METKTGKKKDRIVPGIFSLTNRAIVFCFASIAQSVFFAIIYRDLHYLIPIIPVVLANFFAVFCFIISGTITVVSKGTV